MQGPEPKAQCSRVRDSQEVTTWNHPAQHLLQQEQNEVQLCLLLVRDFTSQVPCNKFKPWYSKITQTLKGSQWDLINWQHWRWLSWD